MRQTIFTLLTITALALFNISFTYNENNNYETVVLDSLVYKIKDNEALVMRSIGKDTFISGNFMSGYGITKYINSLIIPDSIIFNSKKIPVTFLDNLSAADHYYERTLIDTLVLPQNVGLGCIQSVHIKNFYMYHYFPPTAYTETFGNMHEDGLGPFETITRIENLFIPAGSSSLYKYAPGWKRAMKYFDNIIEDSTMTVTENRFRFYMDGDWVMKYNNDSTISTLCYYANEFESDTVHVPVTSSYNGIVSTIDTIGYRAFANYNFKKIYIPETIHTLRSFAFCATPVEDIIGMEGVDSIGIFCFTRTRINKLKIPENVTFVATGLLDHSIDYLEFPENVLYLDDYALYGINIKNFVCRAEIPPYTLEQSSWGGNSLLELNFETCILKVPGKSVELYKNTPGWSQFKNIVPIEGTEINNLEELDYIESVCDSYTIYNLDGTEILFGKGTPKPDILPPGIYLIKTPTQITKVAIH